MTTLPDRLTASQAAEAFGVHEKTLRRLAARGEIEAEYLGYHTLRFRSEALEAWARGKTARRVPAVGGGVATERPVEFDWDAMPAKGQRRRKVS